jgi:nickel-dependent lactate racemase
MRVHLAYGRTGLDIDVDTDRTDVIRPAHRPASADPAATLRRALREPVAGPPLRDRVASGSTVAISVCDVTRAQPRELMVNAVLAELDGLVARSDVTILIATGTHRANTGAELRAMLGDEIADTVRIVNHDARDADSLVWRGTHSGVPVWLDKVWCDADVRITTGFVEPHFFAGFSGGPKLVVPGLAGLDTVLVLHDATRIGSDRATWGVTEGNPVHDDIRAVVGAVGDVTYALDVTLDDDQRIVSAYGGDLFAMHAAACAEVRDAAMVAVPQRYDVVITTGSGYPLDQNLYQSVKGMSAAATVVKPGGSILCVAECSDGFPDHGSYREVLSSAPSPQELLAGIAARPVTVPDQWQVQVQAKIQVLADVSVATGGLTAVELAEAQLGHVNPDAAAIEVWVASALTRAGAGARMCVLPEGPQTVPYVASEVLAPSA